MTQTRKSLPLLGAGPSTKDTDSAPAGFNDKIGSVEQCGIEFIPDEARRSSPTNLFYILSGGSLTFSVIIIGWFPVSFGLGWWQSFSAVLVGTFIGSVLLAPMGLMGPRTGTNNPVASGAFFGVAGRLIGSLLEATASLAFAALSIWTGGDALAGALAAFFHIHDATVPKLIAYGALSVIVTLVSVLGHANMVAAQRLMVPTAGLCMVVGLFVYGRHFDPSFSGTHDYALGSETGAWALSVLLCASTVASYGAYVGDWTRHISRKKHSDRSVVRAIFVGGMLGMGLPFLWGTLTACALFSSGTSTETSPYVGEMIDGAPLWFVPALVYLGLASGTAQAVINTYGTGLDTSAIIPKLSRVQATLVACTLSAALVYLGHFYSALVTGMGVYLQLLACFSVPWIIIVTIGHFSRRAFYDPDALQVFNRGERGGIYWYWRGFNLRGMLVWTVSAGTGLFFANNTWFAGPGSALVDGADIGFVVAGVVAAIAYPLVLKIFPEPAEVFGDLSRGASTSIERRFDTEPTPEFT